MYESLKGCARDMQSNLERSSVCSACQKSCEVRSEAVFEVQTRKYAVGISASAPLGTQILTLQPLSVHRWFMSQDMDI